MTTPLQVAGTELLLDRLEDEGLDEIDGLDELDKRVSVEKLEDVVVDVSCARTFVLVQVSTPPKPVEHALVGIDTPRFVDVEITSPPGQVTTPPRPVEQDVTVVVLSTVVVETLIDGICETEVTDVPAPPSTPLNPSPAVPPTPRPTLNVALNPTSDDDVSRPKPTSALKDADKPTVTEAWIFNMVLLDGILRPTPIVSPAPPPTVATTQAFKGSPPFVQVFIAALFVVTLVAPTSAEVMPFALTDMVALMNGEIDGKEVVRLLMSLVFTERPGLVEIGIPDGPTPDVAPAMAFVSVEAL